MNGLSNSLPGSNSSEHADEGESESSPPDPSPQSSKAPNSDAEVVADPAVCIAWHRPFNHELDAWLVSQFAAVTALIGVNAAAISLVIVDDEEMAELHERYKGVAGTTDVLTFDLSDPADLAECAENGTNDGNDVAVSEAEIDLSAIEGDVIICYDEANRQAKRRGHALSHELLLYAVHGLLHLLGYDDHDEADAAVMHAREDELLTEIGLGPVFASGAE